MAITTKKRDTEVVVDHGSPSVRKSKTGVSKKKLPSNSRARAKAQMKALEAEDLERQLAEQSLEAIGPEQEYLTEYLRMFRRLRRMTKRAYERSMESGNSRDYYSFCTLVSQQREVIADIRTLTDLSGQVDMITQNVVQPAIQELGQVFVNSYYQMRRLVLEVAVKEQTKFALTKLEDITKDVATALQLQYAKMNEKVGDILMGPQEEPAKTKKRRK